jgi:surfactin synthase thioesterase subunit
VTVASPTRPALVALGERRAPALRLICFPFAGGGATAFRTWPLGLPRDVEVLAYVPPGREGRTFEPLVDHAAGLADEAIDCLAPHLDAPHVLFGHSMGSIVAYEVAARTRSAGLRRLVVAGHTLRRDPDHRPVHALPDAEFVQEVRRLNGTPDDVLANEDIMPLLIPVLRSDIRVAETYRPPDHAPLDCPISAYGGLADPSVSREDLEDWRGRTRAGFSARMLPGDHFFLRGSEPLLLELLSRELTGEVSGER